MADRKRIRSHTELDVYRSAQQAAMDVLEASKQLPKEEMYSLTDQMRRSSRSVCGNIGEAWRKRLYAAAFVSKLSDAEAEAAETQVWIEFAVKCGYWQRDAVTDLYQTYDKILASLVHMINHSDDWIIKKPNK